GRAWKPAALAKATLEADLRLLPPNCGLVAQAAMLANPQFSISKAIGDLGGMLPGGMDATQILGKLTEGILMVAERVGNVRIERITLGVADNVGDDTGFVVIVVRGAYDAAAASAALQQIGLNATKVDGMDVLAADREFRVIPCSNRRLVMIGGPRQAVMPVEDVIAAIKTPPDALRLNEELAALVRKADVTQPLWAVATLTDAYRQTPVTAPFDTATLTTQADEKGDLAGTLVAVGKDAEAVKRVADLVNNGIKEGITELTEHAGRMPAMKPMLDILKSIQVNQADATLTITAKLKGSFILPMMPMLMMGRAVGHKMEAVPPQVMEEAVPAPR
ncbi:hypothetical protein HQ576_08215, partial [bacterium]|nr:hypothetical protein [bacterium]